MAGQNLFAHEEALDNDVAPDKFGWEDSYAIGLEGRARNHLLHILWCTVQQAVGSEVIAITHAHTTESKPMRGNHFHGYGLAERQLECCQGAAIGHDDLTIATLLIDRAKEELAEE